VLQDEQEPPAHPEQPPLLPAMICDPLWAKNTEIALCVWLLWHDLHGMGVSASFIDRSISKRFPQSLHIYS
jgi:hypothetical protein